LHKKILILAITVSFIITSVPFAEASVGWNGFLRDIGFGGTQVYEVSGVSVIPATETIGNVVKLRCLDGDWLSDGPPFSMTIDPSVDTTNIVLTSDAGVGIHETDPSKISFFSKLIGVDVTPILNGPLQLFDIPVTVTGLCFSPSPLSSVVGGEWQSSDTVALFIGYSVLNAYWLAPLAIGAGAGVYLTKSKLKKK